jgi:hypothetical protein
VGTIMTRDFRFRIAHDPRGRISTGRLDQSGKPEKLSWFDLSDFPELAKMYGDKPAALIIMLPTDQPSDFVTYRMERWAQKTGKPTMIRFCDGDRCVHRIQETIGGIEYAAGEETDCVCAELDGEDKQRCRHHFSMKAWVCDPQTFAIKSTLCYLFDNHSRNSAEQVLSEIKKMQTLNNGRISMIPFEVSVKMVSDTLEAKKTFPIWSLRSLYMLDKVRALTPGPAEVADVPAELLSPSQRETTAARTVKEYDTLIEEVQKSRNLEDLRIAKSRIEEAKTWLSQEQLDTLDQIGAIRQDEIKAEEAQKQVAKGDT